MRYEIRPHRVCPIDRASKPQVVSQMCGPPFVETISRKSPAGNIRPIAFAQLSYPSEESEKGAFPGQGAAASFVIWKPAAWCGVSWGLHRDVGFCREDVANV